MFLLDLESTMKYPEHWQEGCDKDRDSSHELAKKQGKTQSNDRQLHNQLHNQDMEMITQLHMQLAWGCNDQDLINLA